MNINCDFLPNIPIAIEVLFVCKSKIELQNVIMRDHSEYAYKNFWKSLCPFIIPKVINGSLWSYIYL